MIYKIRTQRKLNVESLFASMSEPESKPFYKYADGDDQIDVLNDTINLVLSRDIRKNVNIAANIAFNVARENPTHDVWYVNTYASIALLKEAFTKELQKFSMPIPEPPSEPMPEVVQKEAPVEEPLFPFVEPAPATESEILAYMRKNSYKSEYSAFDDKAKKEAEHDMNSYAKWHAIDEWSEKCKAEKLRLDEEKRQYNELHKDEEERKRVLAMRSGMLPNLFIHDVPLGTWDTSALGEDIYSRCLSENHPVVIMNSFEFAPISRAQKEKMAFELIELRDQLGLTLMIFSHKMNWDIEAGLPGRGALGVLAAKSGVVVRLKDPFEHLIRVRDLRNRPKRGRVNEAQMRSRKLGEIAEAVRKEAETTEGFADYHRNPWNGRENMTGWELWPCAKTELLQKYYDEHEMHIFTRGLEPTETQLATGTYVPKEVKLTSEQAAELRL